METSPLVYRENQRTGFYMPGISAMKELKQILLYLPIFPLIELVQYNFFSMKTLHFFQ